jgi:hypothetical protein
METNDNLTVYILTGLLVKLSEQDTTVEGEGAPVQVQVLEMEGERIEY